jgi:hypothetical protein
MKYAAPRLGQAGSEIHAAHAATRRHAATAAGVLLRQFGHHGFGGDQQSRNRGCVLDRRPHDLGRVDDALGDQVDVFARLRVEAVGVLILLEDLADDDRTVLARVDRDLARRIGEQELPLCGKRAIKDFNCCNEVQSIRASPDNRALQQAARWLCRPS